MQAPRAEVGVGVHRAWAVAVAVATAGWVAATLTGGDVALLSTNTKGTAAAAAAAALAGPAWRPRTRASVIAGGTGLVLLPPAVALASGGSALWLSAVLVVVAAGEVVVAFRKGKPARSQALRLALALAAASGCFAAAVFIERGEGASWALPAADLTAVVLGLMAASLLLAVATLGPPRHRPFVVPALLIGLVAATGLSPLGSAVAGVAAAVAWTRRLPGRPTPVLAALAVAAAGLPAGGQSSALLAAGAVLALALAGTHPAGAILGLPGAAALATAVVTTEAGLPLVVLVLGTTAALVLVVCGGNASGDRTTDTSLGTGRDAVELAPAAALALWLVLSPGSWGWTGGVRLGAYDRGALAATAAAGLSVVGRRVMTGRPERASRKTPGRGF